MSDLISRQVVLDLLQMKYSGKELYKAIYDLPSAFEGMTNGEVIQALFPNANYESCKNFMHITSPNICGVTFFWDFWNAPYKAESEDE